MVTFIIAAGWHLGLFKSVYDELGIFTRKEPIIPLGLTSMLMQALIVAYIYPRFQGDKPLIDGLKFGLLMGVFMGSYAVFADAAKLEVNGLGKWLLLESVYYLFQFSIMGMVVGKIYGKKQ